MASLLLQHFHEGGFFMYPILIIGILSTAVVVDRYRALYQTMPMNKEHFFKSLTSYLFKNDLQGMMLVCDQNPTPLSKVVKACLIRLVNKSKDSEIQAALDEGAMMETPAIEHRIGFLAVIANVSTLLGLLGTVTGMIIAFKAVATADPATKAALLTRGIAEAMNATAFGLIVAIPNLVAYSILQTRAQRLIDDINEISMRTFNFILANRERFGVVSEEAA